MTCRERKRHVGRTSTSIARNGAAWRSIPAAVASCCFACGALLAWHYPIFPTLVLAAFLLWGVLNYRWPFAWLIAIPALLPISGFATWTGWFAFEELDLLVLGAAAGGYARLAARASQPLDPANAVSTRCSGLAKVALAVLVLSYTVSLYRGVADAGGFAFDWYGSYQGPMNSIRLCKSFALALLLWPLLRNVLRVDVRRALQLLGGGLALGLTGAVLAVVWERAAFTNLLNFSTDYRTTALFWEMHVGGAAFDGFLALTVPFVAWELWRKTGRMQLGMAFALAALATYACLTTFSRSVYLAVPFSLVVLGVLRALQQRALPGSGPGVRAWRAALVASFQAAVLYVVFRGGGYRALLAFLATLAIALTLDPAARPPTFGQWTLAAAAGLCVAALGGLLATMLPKGPYLVFGLAFACNVGLYLYKDAQPRLASATLRWAGLVWLAIAAAMVALHWGGAGAFADSSWALLALLAITAANTVSPNPWLPTDLWSRAVWLGAAALLAAGVAVFAGGAYMGDRFSTTSNDLNARNQHWRDGIGLLHSMGDWWLGKGLGRFPASYFFNAPDRSFPGSYQLHEGGGERFLSMAGPRYPTSWGDLLRVAQRVHASPGTYTASLDAHAARDVELHVEVCEQHLLYNAACAATEVVVRAQPGWQRLSIVMDGRELSSGAWYAPRLAFFALAVASSGLSIDIRDVSLIGPDGSNLLVNGQFANGMARWIPISERLHLPWHMKNLALNVLFDQGLLGLVAFVLLLGVALWRLAFGVARYQPLAPFLAASLSGFVVVGAFDSLLDVPRVAFLFYLLLLVSLSIPASKAADSAAT